MSLALQHPLFSYSTTTTCTTGESLVFDAGESAYTTRRLELLSQSDIILVRDPPRERLSGARSSEENLEHEQVQPSSSLLVRRAGKSEADQKIIYTHPHSHSPIRSIDCETIPHDTAITELYANYMSDATGQPDSNLTTSEIPLGKSEKRRKSSMVKKRVSLQAIFAPSFLQNGPLSPPSSPTKSKSRLRALSVAAPSSPTESVASNSTISSDASGSQHQQQRSFTVGFNSVKSSTPSRCSPPPAFLLDDDPFANLTAAPSLTLKRKFSSGSSSNSATRPSAVNDAPPVPLIPPVPPIPRSPLHEPSVPQGIMALVALPSHPIIPVSSPFASTSSVPSSPPATLPRAISNGRVQTRPAYQRPAFANRPSLPSLDTLARMHVVMTKKVRKGRVGAGLPFEPWDDLPSDDEAQTPVPRTPGSSSPSSATSSSSDGATTPPMEDLPFLSSSASTSSSNVIFQPPPVPEPSTSQPSPPQVRQPQPLLPSQILALGNIVANVQMVLPAPTSQIVNFPYTTSPPAFDASTEIPPSESQHLTMSYSQDPTTLTSQTQSQHRNQPSSPHVGLNPSDISVPVSNSSSLTSHLRSVDPSATVANNTEPAVAIALRLSGLGEFADEMNGVLNDVIGVDGDVINSRLDEVEEECELDEHEDSLMETPEEGLSSVEGSGEDGYFSDFLESYQRSAEGGMDDADDEFDTRSYVDDSGVVDGVEEVEKIEFAARSHLSYFYVSEGEDENDGHRPKGDDNHDDENYDNHDGDDNASELPVFPASESHPSPQSSSISLLRSGSSKSYASQCSSNSSVGMEYRTTTAYPNHSLSSLELELDGPAGSEPYSTLSRSLSERERIADSGTRRSSGSYHTHSHDGTPALSRTRSSSEDSDVPLHSPNADDWTSFSYSYQPGDPVMYSMPHPTSQSALFASALSSRQAEQRAECERRASGDFHADTESSSVHHVDDPAHSDEENLEHAFGEYRYSQFSPRGEAGFGFGFDKIMLAGEVADVTGNEELAGNEKKNGGLATSTSSSIDIEVHRTTVTTSSESSSLNTPPSFDTCNPWVSHRRILSYVSASSRITRVYSRTRTPPSTPCESAAELAPFSPLPLVDMDLLRTSLGVSGQMSLDQPEDGGGERYPAGNSEPWSATGSYSSYQTNYSSALADFRSVRGRGGGRRNFGDEDDEDDEERRRRRRAAFERGSGAEGAKRSSVSTEEDDEDGYGSPNEVARQPHQRPPTRPWVSTSTGTSGSRSASPSASTFSRSRSNTSTSATATSATSSSMPQTRFPISPQYHKHYNESSTNSSRYVSEAESDSDDVPLAERIPGALTIQKSIRRQFKEEKQSRRRERAQRQNEDDSERRSRQMTLRPAGAGAGYDGSLGLGTSSSHDAAILAAASVSSSQPKRPRTLTLPGNSCVPLAPSTAFNPQDLARKLAHVQLAEVASSPQHAQFLPQQQTSPSFQPQHLRSRSKSVSRTSNDAPHPYDPSFGYSIPPTLPPLPIAPASTTRSRSIRDPSSASSVPTRGRSPISSTAPLQPPSDIPSLLSVRSKRSFRRPSPTRPSIDDPRSMPPLPNGAGSAQLLRASTMTRPNRETLQNKRSMSLSRGNVPITRESPPPVPPANLPRTSGDVQRKPSMKAESRVVSARPSVDVERSQRNQALLSPVTKSLVSQQRVFVGNLQQFNMVEIGPTTTAGDVVSMMEAGGSLVGWAGSGGWMVFEIAQDFGMERPVRSYELLGDVQAGWLKDKTVNFFILRLTPFAGPLGRNNIPSSSPTHSGYIEWEAKRGKWSKRWMQLRGHSIWLSKRDNGRDETLLCSLSNFDAYQITRVHRAPKPFAFAIKSTDNLSFFENTADYLHTFACSEKDGKVWMEKILVARSYVLHQERNVLFNPKPDASAPLARSGTRKTSSAASHRPAVAQPLVPLLYASSTQSLPQNDVFEPGSLLSKQP